MAWTRTGARLFRFHLLFCARPFSSTSNCCSCIPVGRDLIVVRHGETDWNKALRVQGSTDIPLNEKGLAQAKASAESLSKSWNWDQSPTCVYSSPLARAKVTAVAIAEKLSLSSLSSDGRYNIQVSTTDALREWNLGVIEGLTKEKAMQDFPRDWRIFSQWANPFTPMKDAEIPLAEGESMEQVRWRVVNAIHDLAANTDDDPIVCVTHGGVLGQLLRHVVQTQLEHNETTSRVYPRPGNACISRFWLDCSKTPPHWTILSWADTSHLTGDLAPVGADYDEKGQ